MDILKKLFNKKAAETVADMRSPDPQLTPKIPVVSAEPEPERGGTVVKPQAPELTALQMAEQQAWYGEDEEIRKVYVSMMEKRLARYEFEVVRLNASGGVVERRRGQARYYTEDLGDGVKLEMAAIPGGTFEMGSPSTEAERWDSEGPVHKVTVSSFYMGKYPVTQAQWRAVARLRKVKLDLNPNPSSFKGDDLPVEMVSWDEAVEFCQRLSREMGAKYRLPTEAEWEYACRAGTKTPFHTPGLSFSPHEGADGVETPEFHSRSLSVRSSSADTQPMHFQCIVVEFYSDEGNEPPHIHVATPDGECKFWLEPVRLARNKGVAPHVVRDIENLVFQHWTLLREKYDEYHHR